VNLKKKHVLETDTCEICDRLAESGDHLISRCSCVQGFWRHIGWDPMDIHPVTQLWKIQAQAGAPKKSLPTMILLCCWLL
jgi:hypothetical protein